MARETTSEISNLGIDSILIKTYRAVQDTEKNLTEKIHNVDTEVKSLSARFDTVIPTFATNDNVDAKIANQKEVCRDDRKKSAERINVIYDRKHNAKLVGIMSGIGAALLAIAELLRNYFTS